MEKREINSDTRFFIDLDLKSGKILNWDYGNRHKLIHQTLAKPFYHRVYVSKGQYNKLVNTI